MKVRTLISSVVHFIEWLFIHPPPPPTAVQKDGAEIPRGWSRPEYITSSEDH